ncbi:hypothetical protein B0T21DRAFT_337046, partial [Apiosordaria backusii]
TRFLIFFLGALPAATPCVKYVGPPEQPFSQTFLPALKTQHRNIARRSIFSRLALAFQPVSFSLAQSSPYSPLPKHSTCGDISTARRIYKSRCHSHPRVTSRYSSG